MVVVVVFVVLVVVRVVVVVLAIEEEEEEKKEEEVRGLSHNYVDFSFVFIVFKAEIHNFGSSEHYTCCTSLQNFGPVSCLSRIL